MQHTAPAALSIAALAGELRRAAAWLQAEADARGVPAADTARLDMCLHEALANVIDHGGLAADSTVRMELDAVTGGATLTVIDGGRPFDPTRADARARPTTLEDTLPGGLGMVMIRSHSDALSYEHRDGCNRLAMTVHWTIA
jgi:serine/threonine-protein kinase RsbW